MKHIPLSEFQAFEVERIEPLKPAELRKRRLERLASLLENHAGPIRLFSQIEAMPDRRRRTLRTNGSPFSIAALDPVLRAEGLTGDTIGEARGFFGLSASETHELVCDCHYFGPVSARTVSERARYIAAHPSLATRLRNFVADAINWSGAA